MVTRFILFFAFFFAIITAFCQSVEVPERYALTPYPAQLEARVGEFVFSHTTTVMVPFAQPDLKLLVESFANQINQSSGLPIPVKNSNRMILPSRDAGPNLIQFLPLRDTTLGNEGYRMDVTDKLITVEANHPKGFFYAIQTLYQLLPPAVLGKGQRAGAVRRYGLELLTRSNIPYTVPTDRPSPLPFAIPACRIQDQPRYRYRGMNLDVSRHFFSVAFIKKYLDLMALHKFNTFHWHLTDDQGWRIEIKKYPKLTQIGSHRRETIVGHYDDSDPQVFDGKPYGGFYTQDEIREVVRYAATKYIDVVPEIELPGHALAVLAAYPDLGCSLVESPTYQVATKWGVFGDVFCPTEKTFTFLENVLTEVIDLFPGKYIHIGGDECPKSAWRQNAYCQQLIKRAGLKNAHGIQRYFINRIDKFVTSKGRRIIGWDEILDGSPSLRLSPTATVMTWRSVNKGIEAARQHHDVIMTPGKFCYFDHYQGDPAHEPTAFGGSLPLATVYSYNPTPAELSPIDATYILGTQGNVWTEYIKTPDEAEYMIWPRAAALAEVAWTPVSRKNYDDFIRRLPTHFERLANLNVNYARTLYDALPSAKPTPEGKVEITLSVEKQQATGAEIRYTLDGSIPSGESLRYVTPFVVEKSTTVRTATFGNGKPLSQLAKVQKEYLISKATGKSYTLLNAPTSSHPDKNYSLTDGTTGEVGGYEVARVASFTNDLNAVIDLGLSQPIERVRIGFLKNTAKNTCLPKQVEISVSEDGKIFQSVLTAKTNAAESGKRAIVRLPFDFDPTTARYVRIIARTAGQVPAGMRTPGKFAKLAVDEIEVR